MNTNDKKKTGLIISYYLSRCNYEAVKALNSKTFKEAFQKVGELLGENPNNIKNMRDEFDPYFDNGRAGWYQREMSPSRKEIYDEFSKVSDDELKNIVNKLLGLVKDKTIMENTDILRDLNALIKQSAIHYNQEFEWQDVELTDEFKNAYEEYLDRNKWKIEYFNATSVITTPTTKNIFVPNQWFVIASYAVGVYSELNRYKGYFEKISEAQNIRTDEYAKRLRDDVSSVDKVSFFETGEKMFRQESLDEEKVGKASKRLWRFVTDYTWWSGQKTIDRGDFYISVVLNMLNLVNASQGYVGDIVNAYGTDNNLKYLTKNLSLFTKNMEGETYDIVIRPETIDYSVADLKDIKTEVQSTPHRIKVSASSIQKLGGRK